MKKIKTFKFKNPINLYCFTDVHIGSKAHDKVKFEKVINLLKKDPVGYCFFNGDNLEFTPGGYHSANNDQSEGNDDQIKYFTKLIKELGKKVLFFRAGNHELRAATLCDVDIYSHLSRELNIPQLHPGNEMVIFEISGNKLKFVSTHGMGGNSKKVMDNLIASYRGADAYFSGHTHEFKNLNEGFETFNMNTEDEQFIQDVPMLVGGSFQKYADYARDLNRRPTQTGCYVLRADKSGIFIKGKIS